MSRADRAVVTGGAGFIGSNLVERLLADGVEVLVIDDASGSSAGGLRHVIAAGARLAPVDVRDCPRLRGLIADFAPSTVYHLAAQIDVRSSMINPSHDAAVNVIGTVNVCAAALAAGVSRVVNTSTGGAIYGFDVGIPTPETQVPRPPSGYGLSKLTAEEYGRWFGRSFGLDVVTLRYGNVYGPRQDPTGDAGVIARFCDRALAGERPVVFGDGSQTRDFVYVDDIVAANLAAARATSLRHDTYNIGTGFEVSVLELIATVARVADLDPSEFVPLFEPARHGEVLRSCLQVDRARADLNLDAMTPLDVGLAATLAWMRNPTGMAAGHLHR